MTKFWPYRLVCYMLYGDLPWMDRLGSGYVVVDSAMCCKDTGIPPNRLREYFFEAQRLMMLENVQISRGTIRVRIAKPSAFLKNLGLDFSEKV
jgi:uncharacterized protein YjfI (DUF2170 family)